MVLAAGKHSLESSIVQGRSFVFQQALSTELSSLILSFFFLLPYHTAEGLADQVTPEHIDKGLIYPPFSIIRKISANIAARVAAKAYDLGIFAAFATSFCWNFGNIRLAVMSHSVLLFLCVQGWLASSLAQRTW
jgi:hypothetical protein